MKNIDFAADSISMFQFFKTWVHKTKDGNFCDGTPVKEPFMCESIRFDIKHTYQIFDLLGNYWGGWNDCPTHSQMRDFAKKMEEEYSLEIAELHYDTVVFRCTETLSEDKIQKLANEFVEISHSDYEYEYNDIKQTLAADNTAVLWWD